MERLSEREDEEIASAVNARHCDLIDEAREVDIQPKITGKGTQLRLHFARADHNQTENKALPIQHSDGAQQIISMFAPLEFGCVKYDGTVVADAEAGLPLARERA